MNTKVFADTYKGHPVIAIWQVDDSGNKVGTYPIVSFGKSKAQAILSNIGDIEKAFTLGQQVAAASQPSSGAGA